MVTVHVHVCAHVQPTQQKKKTPTLHVPWAPPNNGDQITPPPSGNNKIVFDDFLN